MRNSKQFGVRTSHLAIRLPSTLVQRLAKRELSCLSVDEYAGLLEQHQHTIQPHQALYVTICILHDLTSYRNHFQGTRPRSEMKSHCFSLKIAIAHGPSLTLRFVRLAPISFS